MKSIERLSAENSDRKENVAVVETDRATYDVIYNIHTTPVSAETIRNTNGVVLEAIGNYQTQEDAEESLGLIREAERSHYRELVRTAAEQEKPVFLVDIQADTYMKHDDRFLKGTIIPVTEFLIGAKLIISGSQKLMQEPRRERLMETKKKSRGRQQLPKQEISRRDFLKAGIKLGAGVYLGLPQIAKTFGYLGSGFNLAGPAREGSFVRKVERAVGNVSRKIHPETRSFTVHGRNNLIAQKSETVAHLLAQESGQKPNVAIVIGAAHYGIENSLRLSPEDRLRELRNDLKEDFTNEGVIARIDFRPTQDGSVEKEVIITLLKDEGFD